MGRKTLLATIVSLLIFSGLLFNHLKNNEKITYPYEEDFKMWNHLLDQSSNDFDIPENLIPQGAILPHHIIVAKQLNQFYKTLSKKVNAKTFIIFSPNHYQEGNANIQTCTNCIYKTTNDDLRTETSLAKKIIKNDLAKENKSLFKNEHGIYSHSQFIKYYFPNAKILPIVFKWNTPKEEIEKLTNWLSKNTDAKETFFMASVDFSHYIKSDTAKMHDISSWGSIYNFDFDNIYDLEIDSPASIYAILKIMENKKNQKTIQVANTNTQDFYSNEIIEKTTSHQFIYFFKGKNSPEKLNTITSLVFTKEFPNPKQLNIFNSWIWQPDGSGTENKNESLKDIRGDEDRFLTGADLIIFDLEENTCKNFSQNEKTIKICKTNNPKEIEELKTNTTLLYIITKEITQKEARKIIDNGADLIINKTQTQINNYENYKGKNIIYSLKKSAGIIENLNEQTLQIFD